MAENKNSYIMNGLMLLLAAVMVIPFLASCSKAGDNSPSISNTQLLVLNLSPDILPVNLYIDNKIQNTSVYRYNGTPTYFYLGILGLPMQIRASGGAQSNLVAVDSVARPNAKYSLFVTGLKSDSSQTAIFTVDTSTVPGVGRGKLRFVNASPRSNALDVYANGTKLFDGIQYKSYSSFVELPAGNYDIRIYAKGDVTTILKEINVPPLTISDSHLYTIYSYGLLGHTDTAAFNAAVIINK